MKKALGKGFSAIIAEESFIEIDVERIIPGKHQPRESFVREKEDELTLSIKEKGVLQPIIVRPKDFFYEIIAGERRFRAAVKAGLSTVPAVAKDVSDKECIQIALIENLQREDLNSIETAKGYKRLLNEFGMTQEELGKAIGKERSSISNTIRLLSLPPHIQQGIVEGKITPGHGRTILSIKDEKQRINFYNEIVQKNLSVRKAEKRAGNVSRETNFTLSAISDCIMRQLGTNVKIKGTIDKGTIEIEYYTQEGLLGILERMKIDVDKI
ncbi:TPA: chromosome partitioning protein ParB [bacterium]|nr:chromosome partitioning protein ParB [bacterium]